MHDFLDHAALMPMPRDSKPRVSKFETARSRHKVKLSISCRAAAALVGRSKTQIHAVCSGERPSADLERRLAPYIVK